MRFARGNSTLADQTERSIAALLRRNEIGEDQVTELKRLVLTLEKRT